MTTALFWSGGKESYLTLLLAMRNGIRPDYLVTFVGDACDFKCHPIAILVEQSRQLRVPHVFWLIQEPYERAYERALQTLRASIMLETVLTGDLVACGSPVFRDYWLARMCGRLGIRLLCPVGELFRHEVFGLLAEVGVSAFITGVDVEKLPSSLLWQRLGERTIRRICDAASRMELDICGENGEYHTTVLEAPGMKIATPLVTTEIARVAQVAYLPLLQIDRSVPLARSMFAARPYVLFQEGCDGLQRFGFERLQISQGMVE